MAKAKEPCIADDGIHLQDWFPMGEMVDRGGIRYCHCKKEVMLWRVHKDHQGATECGGSEMAYRVGYERAYGFLTTNVDTPNWNVHCGHQ
jgi:hypothetical protein